MKYYYKLFLWKDGKLGEELTKYLTAPIYIETRLNEIGTAKFILDAMPTNIFSKPFEPKTKMRLLRSTVEDFSNILETFDYIVDADNMEVYQGCPKLCKHEITLYEPLIVTQDWHIDNISTTRQLKDITLDYSTLIVSDDKIGENGITRRDG